MNKLQRTTFKTSRDAEYFNAAELSKQTGQSSGRFGDVVLKELADNALDAVESTAGAVPEVVLGHHHRGCWVDISVADNGPGIPPETIEKILDFSTRTSDKARYRSPTRGAQGNALKTVIGIPHALGVDAPIIVESLGIRHEIKPVIDAAGRVRVTHEVEHSERSEGTEVTVPLPEEVDPDPERWARAFSLFNPHAIVKMEWSHSLVHHVNCPRRFTLRFTIRLLRVGFGSTSRPTRRVPTGTIRNLSERSSARTWARSRTATPRIFRSASLSASSRVSLAL